VFAWQRALAERGMAIDGWRIHRRIGMSGGLFTRAVGRELGRSLGMLSIGLLSGGYGDDELTRAGAFRVYRDAAELHAALDDLGIET
jgi:hypothetical protein